MVDAKQPRKRIFSRTLNAIQPNDNGFKNKYIDRSAIISIYNRATQQSMVTRDTLLQRSVGVLECGRTRAWVEKPGLEAEGTWVGDRGGDYAYVES